MVFMNGKTAIDVKKKLCSMKMIHKSVTFQKTVMDFI